MRMLLTISAAAAAALATGCGDSIGDSCSISSECSPQGDRLCDVNSPGGYCTVFGCDHDSCPEEAVCIRFFGVAETNLPCDPQTEDISTDDCTPDELCALSANCVPRTAEVRFCMLKCSSGGDCREGYECRDEALMRAHGGEPVPPPGEPVGDNLQAFCAAAPFESP